MKQLGFLPLTFLCVILLVACTPEEAPDGSYVSKDSYSITVTDSVFIINSDSQTLTIDVNATGTWRATSSEQWISLDPTERQGSGQLRLNIANNNDKYYPRTGHVYLVSGPIKRTLDISQESSGTLTVTVGDVSFKMIPVEHGSFTMGKDSTAHQVTLTKDYKIGQTEVTQALWTAVTGEDKIRDISILYWLCGWNNCSLHGKRRCGNNYPASSMDYDEIQDFINKLNELSGLKFRMPTEAEWEFAAKGGKMSKGYVYSGSNILEEVAVRGSTWNQVATKKPNELGLYDMSGNLAETVCDWYGPSSTAPTVDPVGPEKDQYGEWVTKGGGYGWHLEEFLYFYEPSSRYKCGPQSASQDDTGFRLAM